MKITAVRLDRMRLPLDPPFHAAWDPVPRRHFDATLVTVETDEGVTGHGSGDTMDGFEPFEPLFTGRDPLRIAEHVATIESIGFHAGAGPLQIFVGGEQAVFGRVRPLLEAMGDPERILHVGGPGAGYTVKLMINLLWFAHLVATAEVLAVGTQAGVDLATLRRCLLASPAASHFLEHDVLFVLEAGDYDDSFALALACKDLGLAGHPGLAGQAGVPVELSAVVEQVYRRARAQYGDAGGEMLPIKLYEDLTRAPSASPIPEPPEPPVRRSRICP